MALLPAQDKFRTAMRLMRDESDDKSPMNFSKAQLSAAVDATDQWIEDNTASYVAALPVGFRTGSTAAQKTILFAYVLMRRAGRLRVPEDG